MTPELMLKPGESPFAGFRERLGDGNKQAIGDQELIEAFSAAMKKAAYDVLQGRLVPSGAAARVMSVASGRRMDVA